MARAWTGILDFGYPKNLLPDQTGISIHSATGSWCAPMDMKWNLHSSWGSNPFPKKVKVLSLWNNREWYCPFLYGEELFKGCPSLLHVFIFWCCRRGCYLTNLLIAISLSTRALCRYNYIQVIVIAIVLTLTFIEFLLCARYSSKCFVYTSNFHICIVTISTATTLIWVTIIPHLDYSNMLKKSPCSYSQSPTLWLCWNISQIMSSFCSNSSKVLHSI